MTGLWGPVRTLVPFPFMYFFIFANIQITDLLFLVYTNHKIKLRTEKKRKILNTSLDNQIVFG